MLTELGNTPLKQYVDFLKQWLDWLFVKDKPNVITRTDAEIDMTSVQSHLNRLKIFHFQLKQDSLDFSDHTDSGITSENTQIESIDELLKANTEFLKNISQN
jgi:hypothetical protein